MILIDAKKVMWPVNDASQDVNSVLQRYIMICIQEVFRLRTRLKTSSYPTSTLAGNDLAFVDEQTRGAVQPIGDFNDRLLALWLMPYLHLANQSLQAEDIDASEFMDYLRIITDRCGGCCPSASYNAIPSRKWMGSGAQIANYFLWGVIDDGTTLRSAFNSSDSFEVHG